MATKRFIPLMTIEESVGMSKQKFNNLEEAIIEFERIKKSTKSKKSRDDYWLEFYATNPVLEYIIDEIKKVDTEMYNLFTHFQKRARVLSALQLDIHTLEKEQWSLFQRKKISMRDNSLKPLPEKDKKYFNEKINAIKKKYKILVPDENIPLLEGVDNLTYQDLAFSIVHIGLIVDKEFQKINLENQILEIKAQQFKENQKKRQMKSVSPDKTDQEFTADTALMLQVKNEEMKNEIELLDKKTTKLEKENNQLKSDNMAYKANLTLIDDRYYEYRNDKTGEMIVEDVSIELKEAIIECDKPTDEAHLWKYLQGYMGKPEGDYFTMIWTEGEEPEKIHRNILRQLASRLAEQLEYKKVEPVKKVNTKIIYEKIKSDVIRLGKVESELPSTMDSLLVTIASAPTSNKSTTKWALDASIDPKTAKLHFDTLESHDIVDCNKEGKKGGKGRKATFKWNLNQKYL